MTQLSVLRVTASMVQDKTSWATVDIFFSDNTEAHHTITHTSAFTGL